MKKKLIIIQMNEVNFDLVNRYIQIGKLKNFKFILDKFKYFESSSEKNMKI